MGNGNSDTITAVGGGGTVLAGNGIGDTITLGSGNYLVTIGSGTGDHITVGGGNNTVNLGTGGTTTVVTGNGSNQIDVGLGTGNTITAGTGSNTINFSGITSAPLTATLGTTGNSTGSGTGFSDTFTGIGTLIGTNQGDTITLNTGTLKVLDGSGNDTITLGSGIDTVYAGNGNNRIIGTNLTSLTGDMIYGGTGNNTYTNPDAGTTYNGTNGQALTVMANNVAYTLTDTLATNPLINLATLPAGLTETYSGGVATFSLSLGTQVNAVNYNGSANGVAMTFNLLTGVGLNGTAQGSSYAMTPTTGHSTINEIVGNNGGDTFYPSLSNTMFVGGSYGNTFNDQNTVAGGSVIIIGNGSGSGTGGTDTYLPGAASEIFAFSNYNTNYLQYNASPAGVILNFTNVSHTFSSSLFASSVSVSAYSGTNWGSDAVNSGNAWSTGDFFLPTSGSSVTTAGFYVWGSTSYNNVVYAGTNFTAYLGGNASDYFYGGTGGSLYYMSAGNDVAVAGGGTNTYYTNTSYNIAVVPNPALDTGSFHTLDSGVSLAYGGTTYTGFAWGWGNATTPGTANVTHITGYENVLGNSGNDYVVGDNNGNQINAEAGTNTIILGDGTNIVSAIQGTNNISSSSAAGQTIGVNTLNFETTNDAYSGIMGGYSSGATSGDFVFLGPTATTYFNTGLGGDQGLVIGSTTYQVLTGNGLTKVQSGIISTINGGDWGSGTVDSVTNASFGLDNIYSGASTIRAHGGNSVFIDSMGTSAQSYYEGSGSNLIYASATQVPDITVYSNGAVTSTEDVFRVVGWGSSTTSGDAFGATDPFATTKITGVNVVDVRTGQDSLSGVNANNLSLTLGGNSVTDTLHPTFNLNSGDVHNLTGNAASSATVTLMLDSGELFTPTAGTHYYAEGSGAAGTGNWVFYIGYTSTPTSYGQTGYTAVVDVHFGAGAFSSTGISATNHSSG